MRHLEENLSAASIRLSRDDLARIDAYTDRLERKIVDCAGAALARLDPSRVSYCGLKDKQGRTSQLVAVQGGPVEIQEPDLRLKPLGRTAAPLSAANTTFVFLAPVGIAIFFASFLLTVIAYQIMF